MKSTPPDLIAGWSAVSHGWKPLCRSWWLAVHCRPFPDLLLMHWLGNRLDVDMLPQSKAEKVQRGLQIQSCQTVDGRLQTKRLQAGPGVKCWIKLVVKGESPYGCMPWTPMCFVSARPWRKYHCCAVGPDWVAAERKKDLPIYRLQGAPYL